MKKIVTINKDYAIKVYCHIFGREDTKGDAYIQGVFDALNTLPERERFALEYRFRDGLTYKQIGEKFGFGAGQAQHIIALALRKMRHPSRARKISVAKTIEANSDKLLKELEKKDRVIDELSARIRSLEDKLSESGGT